VHGVWLGTRLAIPVESPMTSLYKILPNGQQPASLTPVVTELGVLGSDETLMLPCVTSTKVEEIKEIIAAKVGVHRSQLSIVSKLGHYHKRQCDHEEVARKVLVRGISTFSRARKEYTHPFGIVGAGYLGLRHALLLVKHNRNFVLMDRRSEVGGTSWWGQANRTTRLQTELGTYHLQYDDKNPVPKNLPAWPTRDEVRKHFKEVSEEYGVLPHCQMNTNLQLIENITPSDGNDTFFRLHTKSTPSDYSGAHRPKETGNNRELRTSCVWMYPGNSCEPVTQEYKGEDQFEYPIQYPVNDKVDHSVFAGEAVAIIGHGAFAIENARVCAEHSASKVYMVCRTRYLCIPRVVSWLTNQSSTPIPGPLFLKSLKTAYDLTNWDPWNFASVEANPDRTSVIVRSKGHLGVCDAYFLAVYMGKLEVIVDTVKRLTKGKVHLASRKTLEVRGILKLLGFTGDWENDRLIKIKAMDGFWVNGDPLKYVCAEPVGVDAQEFGGMGLAPRAQQWVEQATHVVNHPDDFTEMLDSNLLPKRLLTSDLTRPAYMIDSRAAAMTMHVVQQFCPQISDRRQIFDHTKAQKQLECHPMRTFVDQATAEWDQYAKTWKSADPALKDPPPYPFTPNIVSRLLAEAP